MKTSHHITIAKLTHDGRVSARYSGERVYADEEMVVARCIWAAPKPFAVKGFRLEAGDIFIEHFYLRRRYNVFAVYDPLGALKGWYANITAPPEWSGDEIRWRDLALDLVIRPDGHEILLDADEFEALPLSSEERAAALDGLAALRRHIDERRPPFTPLQHIAPRGAPSSNRPTRTKM
ncbi:MAG TPA: DUF402 domain-containing protein [Chloroflexi bacterium]|jgi:protein associated with RNAse G/E|nr:DUF402 domain-containing protein [Chloroflexota bacterium]